MSIPSDQLELLSQQINHAHRSAVSEELNRRGLSEIGHPMLLTVLEGYQSDDPEGHAQRDLAVLLHISPAAVANSLKSLERGGLCPPGAGAEGCQAQPGDADGQGPLCGGGLPGGLSGRVRADAGRLYPGGAAAAAGPAPPDAGKPAPPRPAATPSKGGILICFPCL